jgi:hypothetical protein
MRDEYDRVLMIGNYLHGLLAGILRQEILDCFGRGRRREPPEHVNFLPENAEAAAQAGLYAVDGRETDRILYDKFGGKLIQPFAQGGL